MVRDNIDILCCAGHKALYGPMGTGFMIINTKCSVEPLMHGGTGSNSLLSSQPDFMPDRFETGTLNNPGIIGLGAGIDFVSNMGIKNIYDSEMKLCELLYDELKNIPEVELYTLSPTESKSLPIISFNYKNYSGEKTALLLADKGICTRGGYHCSYLAHRAFNTTDRGTVRISMGIHNTQRECIKMLNVLKNI
jgi:selenocysteine lyase/cysteine desulfurase